MTGKLFRAGSQTVLALPQDVLERLHLAEGVEVNIQVDDATGRLVIQRADATASVDDAFAREVRDFIERYRPALSALAK